ncbi:MAG TPA: class I SAM-dependent methyltransferase [Thermoanaerobaculia bacterium]|nr:class I SAM-dependent methyltransferase [Thermoanaerobaculia bacterium]
MLICPKEGGRLVRHEMADGTSALHCDLCGRRYPVEHGIADFAEGAYYDQFDESTTLSEAHLEGLRLEIDGASRRINDFYLPLIEGTRVLDCGCGNGISVDLLQDAGFDAWGNDLSALRKWQWRERAHRDRLVVASALALPFPDGYFDAVLSSGVIEHIGVAESANPYRVAPLPDRDAQRAAFMRELLRVLAPGGVLFLDCPNGAFPIDFWHGDAPGKPRFHSTREGFLPSFAEIDALVGGRAEALSPYKRLQFRQAAQHWYGRAFSAPMEWLFRLMRVRGFRWLAKSALNPFLVARASRPP